MRRPHRHMTLQCESRCAVSGDSARAITVKYPKTCPPRLMTFAGMVLPSHSMIANPLPRNFLFLLSRHLLPKTPAHRRFIFGTALPLCLELRTRDLHNGAEFFV